MHGIFQIRHSSKTMPAVPRQSSDNNTGINHPQTSPRNNAEASDFTAKSAGSFSSDAPYRHTAILSV